MVAVLVLLLMAVAAYKISRPDTGMSRETGAEAEDGNRIEACESTEDAAKEESASLILQAYYVDAELYAYIKKKFDNIDFNDSSWKYFNMDLDTPFCGFQNASLHQREYKKMFLEEKTVMIPATGEEVSISDLLNVESSAGSAGEKFETKDYAYFFADLDGESGPELLVADKSGFTYVFQYEPQADQIILSKEYISDTVYYGYYESFVCFKVIRNKLNGNQADKYGYFVFLPEYYVRLELDETMKAQAYFDENDERLYFRITGEQYSELLETINENFVDTILKEEINDSFVLYDEYYWNGDDYAAKKVTADERSIAEEDLLAKYGMTEENLYLTSVKSEDGYASYGTVRMYYNEKANIYLTLFCQKQGASLEMEVFNVCDGSLMEKLDKKEYGILSDPFAFVSREGTSGREYVTDFQEEKQYDEKGNLVSYRSYGTDINEFQYQEGEPDNILELLKIDYTFFHKGALKIVEIYNNQWVWGTYHSSRYYQYDESGRCIYMSGYITHGGDSIFYLYNEKKSTPMYAVVFDGFYRGYDEVLRVYEY